MLATVDPALLDRVAFPLGGQGKRTTRDEAAAAGLAVAERAESQEACFLAGDDYRTFLERQGLARRPGPIVDEDGVELGRHDGVWRYTPGQRRGIGLATPEPVYALRADTATNTLTVGPRGSLEVREVSVRGRLYLPVERAEAKLRYRSDAVPALGRGRRTTDSRSTSSSPRSQSRRVRWPSSTTTTQSSEQASSSPQPGRITAMTQLAFSAGDAAYWGLAVFLVAIGLASAFMLFRLGQAFERLSSFIKGTERDLLPVIVKTGGTVDRVNYQLDKADTVTDSAVSMADSADTAVRAISTAIATPVEKVSGLAAGITHGFSQFRKSKDFGEAKSAAQEASRRREADLHDDLRNAGRTPMETDRPAAQPRPDAQPKPDPWPRPTPVPKPEPGSGAAGRRAPDRRVRLLAANPLGRRRRLRTRSCRWARGSPELRRTPRSCCIPARTDAGARASAVWPAPVLAPVRSPDAYGRRAPRGLSLLLRVEGTPSPSVRAVDPAGGRRVDPVHRRRHAADEEVVPRRGATACEARRHLAEGDARRRQARRPRRRRLDRPPRLVLRDARQLLVRRLLQGRGDPLRLGVRDRAHGLPRRAALGDRVRRRSRARARRGRRRRAGLARRRPAARAHRRPAALGELLAGGRHRPVRAVLRDLLRPRARARLRRPDVRAELRALRALPRVLEPRLHGVRPRRRRHADAAAAAEHRHRARPRARRHAPAGGRARSSTPTATRRSCAGWPRSRGSPTATPSRRRRRTASSPTTAARWCS